jgi:hypothetical protein
MAFLGSEPSMTAEPVPAEPVRTEPARAEDASDLDRARLDRVERELVLLRQGVARAAAEAQAAAENGAAEALATTDADDLAPPPDPEQEYVEQQAVKQDWLTRHAMEAVNASWAPGAEQDIEGDLDRLKDQEWAGRGPIRFEVVGVSCRTSLCVVEVAWDSARTAVEDGAYLATHDYAQSCIVTVFGPSPDEVESDSPFVQEILFDCA